MAKLQKTLTIIELQYDLEATTDDQALIWLKSAESPAPVHKHSRVAPTSAPAGKRRREPA
ncbi:MAG: hypothetical protein AMXMBFR8_10080 [Nevskiales bacterium]